MMKIIQKKLEDETKDAFAKRVRTAMRIDPGCILLGEIRGTGDTLKHD